MTFSEKSKKVIWECDFEFQREAKTRNNSLLEKFPAGDDFEMEVQGVFKIVIL